MSIIVTGAINCQKAQKGKAILSCEIGDFVIIDDKLKSLPIGEHEGLFEIKKIKPISNVTEAGLSLVIAAEINKFALTKTNLLLETGKEEVAQGSLFSNEEKKAEKPDESIVDIFGSLCPLGDMVKLDPSVDRETLRRQTSKLKELNYQFDKNQQAWFKSNQ